MNDLRATAPAPSSQIYFSEIFGVSSAVLESYGAFDLSLINDLPVFVDPFLLFNSKNPTYQLLHDKIISYLKFLRDKSNAGPIADGLLRAWFTFPEVKQNWLGYSLRGNRGRGLGMDFARALNANLKGPLASFGSETVTRGSHLEKMCLIGDGIGRDNVSDFTTNLIKGFLLTYTEVFAKKNLRPDQRRLVSVVKSEFNYKTESWEAAKFELPFVGNEYVILTPTDILTRDEAWINREDLGRQFDLVVASVSNDQLRAQLNSYFDKVLFEITERDRRARAADHDRGTTKGRRSRPADPAPTGKQRSEAGMALVHAYPQLIDYYIKLKEDSGDEAIAQAGRRVRATEELLISQVRQLALRLAETAFYDSSGGTLAEARQRVVFLKDVIENKGGWRIFYVDGQPVRRESDVHIMFRLTWCNTPSDVNREVNNGRGPSDFEVSRGRFDKSLIEFKLASNSGLAKNLQAQAEVYKKASDAQHALKVIVFFTEAEEVKTTSVLKGLELDNHPDVLLIDARSDNKPSGSKAH